MKIQDSLLTLPLLLLGFSAACTSPWGDSDASDAHRPPGEPMVPQVLNSGFDEPAVVFMKPHAWTDAFDEPALLFADSIQIEGPQGLLDHFIARHADEYHSYSAETLPEGFRQVYKVLDPAAGVELRAHLDALELVVLQSLVVIEKPGRQDVLVRARGNVYHRDTTTGAEQRASTLLLSGPIRPDVAREESASEAEALPAAPTER